MYVRELTNSAIQFHVCETEKKESNLLREYSFPYAGSPAIILLCRSQNVCEERKLQALNIINRFEQQKEFLELKCWFFCTGTPVYYISPLRFRRKLN
jgi:hypothetical protein